jgi:hypothetical protein
MDILSVVASCSALFLAGINAAIFCVVKFNDLKHLQVDLKEIKDSIDCIDKKLYVNAEKIGMIEGKCKANHPGVE